LRRWPEVSPLVELHLPGIVARDWRTIDGPHLNGVRGLSLTGGASSALEAVAASPHLGQLEELHLTPDRSNIHWPEDQYRAFAASPLAERVKRLHAEVGSPAQVLTLYGGLAQSGAPLGNLTALDLHAPFSVTEPDEIDNL